MAKTAPEPFTLQRALDDLGGDTGLLDQLVAAYLEELSPTLQRIGAAHAAGDRGALVHWVHRLRGSFAVLHADGARQLAASIEVALAAGAPIPSEAVSRLALEASRLGEQMAAWRPADRL
jgi:HPt (histidine-containing phosphotransfer) domain-containing protein